MKRLVFATMLLFAVSANAFAMDDNSENKIKVNERDAPACADRGGVCYVIMTLNGVTRTYRLCCQDVVVVGQPEN